MRLIIVPAGKSLLERQISNSDNSKTFDPRTLDKVYWNNYGYITDNYITTAIEILCSYNIKEELKKRKERDIFEYKNDPDRFPAEISSLLLFWKEEVIQLSSTNIVRKDSFNYKIKLLRSDTPQSDFCARVIQGYFNKKIDNNFIRDDDLIKIVSLSENGAEFNKGLKNLLENVNSLVSSNNYDEIIFNITTGFKGVIPYLTLAGMCYENVRIIYLYETSHAIVTIPKLPIGFDVIGWNDNRAFIYTLKDVKGIYSEIKQLPMSGGFKNLFEIKDSKPSLSSFGDFLSGEYEKRKKEKALSEFGRGYILVDLINNRKKREKLKKWINNSHLIWYGDNIPETVDHSRGHCQRLLELSAQIIKPYNTITKPPLLNDDELIVLILVLWFHDIGHSSREIIIPFDDQYVSRLLGGNRDSYEFYDISGFPETIRELHHILGFIRLLKYPEYYHFSDDRKNEEYLPIKYLKAAALSYLYHRKRTPLNSDKFDLETSIPDSTNGKLYEYTYSCPKVEIKNPIKGYQSSINELFNPSTIDIKFITAIQTLVDECDNCKERTGDEEFRERRRAQTDFEIITEYKRLKYLLQKVDKNYEELLKFFKNSSGDWKEEKEILRIRASKNKIDGENINIIEELNKIICNNNLITKPEENPILTECLKCHEKIIFKLFQKSHFEKSGSVDSVFIMPEKTDNGLKYKIVLETEYVNNEGKPMTTNEKGGQLENACKDILIILNKVKNIFNRKKLNFGQKVYYKKETSSDIKEIILD